MSASSSKKRYLSLSEVADLIGVDAAKPARDRRRYVQRLFEALEAKDGAKYLHADRTGKGARYRVCVEDLGRLDPWDPNTITALKENVEALALKQSRQSKRLKALEDFCEAVSEHLKVTANDNQSTAKKALN